ADLFGGTEGRPKGEAGACLVERAPIGILAPEELGKARHDPDRELTLAVHGGCHVQDVGLAEARHLRDVAAVESTTLLRESLDDSLQILAPDPDVLKARSRLLFEHLEEIIELDDLFGRTLGATQRLCQALRIRGEAPEHQVAIAVLDQLALKIAEDRERRTARKPTQGRKGVPSSKLLARLHALGPALFHTANKGDRGSPRSLRFGYGAVRGVVVALAPASSHERGETKG